MLEFVNHPLKVFDFFSLFFDRIVLLVDHSLLLVECFLLLVDRTLLLVEGFLLLVDRTLLLFNGLLLFLNHHHDGIFVEDGKFSGVHVHYLRSVPAHIADLLIKGLEDFRILFQNQVDHCWFIVGEKGEPSLLFRQRSTFLDFFRQVLFEYVQWDVKNVLERLRT